MSDEHTGLEPVDLDELQKRKWAYDYASRKKVFITPEERNWLVREIVQLREQNAQLLSEVMLS